MTNVIPDGLGLQCKHCEFLTLQNGDHEMVCYNLSLAEFYELQSKFSIFYFSVLDISCEKYLHLVFRQPICEIIELMHGRGR